MKLRRLLTVLSVLALLASLFTSTAFAITDRQREIESERSALRDKIRAAEQQAKSLTQQLAESDARKSALERESSGLAARLTEAQSRLETAEADLGTARSDLINVESSLAATLGRTDQMRTMMQERSRQLYQSGGGGSYAGMLLGATSIRDLVSRVQFVMQVVDRDGDRIAAIGRLTKQLESSRTEVVQRKEGLTTKLAAIEAEKANIASLREAVKRNRQQVEAEIANRQQLLKKVQADKAGYLREMTRLEAESRSIAALLRSRQKGQVYQVGSGTKLAWPTTGRVTSPYGYRTHPVFGDRRMHYGIDIGAPTGQAVIAAESGTVIHAASKGGYGMTVIIDHGNALATLYAHLSSISVASGSTVARGARVGAVGCTGYCTGPHLHFETRINGEPQDPMRFF